MSDWISVEKRLPDPEDWEPGDSDQFKHSAEHPAIGPGGCGIFMALCHLPTGVWYYDMAYRVLPVVVTHWYDLPDPPEVNE